MCAVYRKPKSPKILILTHVTTDLFVNKQTKKITEMDF